MTRPGPPLIDVTSSRFLGLRHARDSLPAWADLTTGVPAALAEPPLAGRICQHVARWQGAGAGLVARSSLHALMDVLGELPRPGDMVAIDEFAYPITEWSALRAAGRGVTVRRYPHHRPGRLVPPAGGRLFTVADGWCPGCNQPAPLGVLRQRAVRAGGLLVVDDSLAFGVVGDGAGTPAWSGAGHDGLVWVASMAKAYGAPLAVLTGGRDVVDVLARGGGNRVHSSPPSAADLAAAASALELGGRGRRAAAARDRVTRHVLYLREALAAAGIRIGGPPFPVLSLPLATAVQARRWLDRLRDSGIRAVLQRPRCRPGFALGVLLRADHAEADVERVAAALCGLARTEAPGVTATVRGRRIRVIDAHCHAGHGDGLSGPFDTDASLDRYAVRAREAGIDGTVLLAALTSDYRRANREVGALVRANPRRYLGFAFVNPVSDARRVGELVDEARAWGACGIKLHWRDGRITREIAEVARRRRMPVLYDPAGDTGTVETAVTAYPDVAWIVPHLSSFADDWKAQVAFADQLARLPNLFADTSGVRYFDVLADAVRRAGAGKVLFGTDGPFLHPGVELAKIRALHLAPCDAAAVLGGNILRLTRAARHRKGRR